jgi:hypothetical protein
VLGLTRRDFEVFDNGRRQDVLDVSIDAMPLEVLLLLDDSASLDALTVARIRAAPVDIARSLKGGDQLKTFGFAGRVSALEGPLPNSLSGSSPERDQTAIFDAIVALVMQPPDPARRRLLIVISDGIDATSTIGHSLRSNVLDRSDVVVDFVVVADFRWRHQFALPPGVFWRLPRGRAELFRASASGIPWVLFDVVERTGGQLLDVTPADDFLPVLIESIQAFRRRYMLHFVPTGVATAGWHDLKVTVPSRNYEVRHRRGYWRASRIP